MADSKEIACKEVKARFRRGDVSGDGMLDLRELSLLLKKGNPSLRDSEVRRLFGQIDQNKDGKIDFGEFCDYVFDQKVKHVVPKAVQEAFHKFKGVNETMSSQEFCRLCKEACLHNDSFRKGDAAILFQQVKAKSMREIGLPHFTKALKAIADKRGCDVEEVYKALAIFSDHPEASAPAWTHKMDAFSRTHEEERKINVGPDGRRTGRLLDVCMARSFDGTGNVTPLTMMQVIQEAGLTDEDLSPYDAQVLVDSELLTSPNGLLTFDHFSQILFQISEMKGCDFSVVEAKIASLAE